MPDQGGGSPGDKQVKLSFVVDEASVQRARKAMGLIISDATKLAEVLKNTSIGGMGGGGGIPLLSGGRVTTGGAQNSNQILAQQNVSPGQRITSALADNSRALQGLAQGSKDALRTMTTALQNSIREQETAVSGLQKKLAGLLETYTKLGEGRAIGPLTAAEQADDTLMRHRMARAIEETSKETDTQMGRLQSLQDSHQKANSLLKGGGAGGGEEEGGAAAAAGGGGFLGKLLKGGLTLGAIRMGLGVAGQVAGMFGTEGNMYAGNIYAGRGQAWGSNYQRAYQGDATLGAETLAMSGKFQDAGSQRFARLFKDISQSTTADTLQSILSNSGDLLGGDVGAFQRALYAGESTEVVRQKAMASMQKNWAQSAGLPLEMAISQFQGQTGQMMGLEQQLGYGGRVVKNVNGKLVGGTYEELKAAAGNEPGAPEDIGYVDPLAGLGKKLAGQNILTGEYAAAMQQMRQSGTTASAGIVAGGMGAGGAWTGLGGLAAQAGIGGQSAQFLRTTIGFNQGMGVNAAAAMGIGGAVAGGLFGGGYSTSGLGAMAALQQGMGRGTGGEEDLMRTQLATGGLQAAGGLWGGGLDKYQGALNFINSGKAFGTNSMATQQYMSTIFGKNPDLAMDIAAGGKIPAGLQGLVTKESAQKFLSESGKSLIGRASMSVTGANAQEQAVLDLQREGGDVKSYLAAHHLKGKKARDFVSKLATGISIGTGGMMDAAQAEGLLDIEAGLGTPITKGKKGGVGAAHSASREAELKAQEQAADKQQKIADQMGTILSSLDASVKSVETFGHLVTSLDSSAQDVVDVFNYVADKVGKQFGMVDIKGDVHAFLVEQQKKRSDEKAAAEDAQRKAVGHGGFTGNTAISHRKG